MEQPEFDIKPFLLKDIDVQRFVNCPFELQRELINQACEKVALMNEKTAEQALILKLNNRIAELEAEIETLRTAQS